MSGEHFTRVVCPECNNDDRGLGALPCNHCSAGFVYTKVEVTPPGTEVVPEGTTLGYTLAMRVLQSSLYDRLDEQERAECDAILTRHRATQKETPNAQG